MAAKYPPPFLRAYEDVVTPNIIESLGVCAGIYPFNFRDVIIWAKFQLHLEIDHVSRMFKGRHVLLGPAIPVKTP
ncbi:hypothetical protein NC653_000013 [Populus alba x Populus x berolinensis]|uniref:Uncharacterized protein n=1 Tax=Populus alba x Populus x berolinensis TaxID=444605 RepID=A0AAD6WDZ7_9ROSI|nr:hypothetical protein NC653_000013 [Populus alba x Populus x berolinensis]